MSQSSIWVTTAADLLYSFWLRFSRDATPSQQRRFIGTFEAYVRAARDQVVTRIDQTCPSIENYIEQRRHASAVWVSGSLI
jgi:uncharacterized protein YueI